MRSLYLLLPLYSLIFGCDADLDVAQRVILEATNTDPAAPEPEWCPPLGVAGPLSELLFTECDGEPEWDADGAVAFGNCKDSRYPELPSPASNPNPESYKIRVRVEDVGGTLEIRYRDGLYPVLPDTPEFPNPDSVCELSGLPQ